MPTTTQTRNQITTTQVGIENPAVIITKSKLPVYVKRNALLEISNKANKSNVALNNLKCHTIDNIRVNNEKTAATVIKEVKFREKDEECEEITIDMIEDIDEYYKDNIFLAPVYAEDIYSYLRSLEVKYAIRKWPLNVNVNDKMRSVLIDWLVDIQVEYDLFQETLHSAVSMIDRYIQTSAEVTVKNLQLIGICCMAIAAKFEEIHPPTISDFLYLCNNTYNKSEFITMEKAILIALNFQISPPLPISFLRRYSLAGKAERSQHIYAKYILDLVLLESSLCHIKPSLIAACSFFISTCLINGSIDKSYWNNQLNFYSKYKFKDLIPLIGKLSKLIINSGKQLKSVKRKYSAKEFEFVSNKLQLKVCLLQRLCEVKP